jgi:uncharacterized phage protein gp47/JayE
MAVFENRTIAEIRDLLASAFQQEFNGVLRILPRSFIKIFATVIAGIFIVLYKMIGWVFLQLYPETAYWKEVSILGFKIRPLVKWGVLWGVGLPRQGTQWKGKILAEVVDQNTLLKAGTQLKSNLTGKIYLTDSLAALEDETAVIGIICNDTGTAGSLAVGDILNFVSPLGNVKKAALVTEITADGTDAETEGDYRYRVVNRYRMQPQGGALADYRMWASEVAGVLNTYPYNDADSPAGVILYVSGNPAVFPDRIPSAALLVQVGDACTYNPETGKATRKPVTAILDPDNDRTYGNIHPVSIIDFDIYISGFSGILASDFAGIVRPAIEDYFLGREPYIRGLSDDNYKINTVSRNNISSTVDQIALSVKSEFETVSMTQEENQEAAYTLGRGELARLRWLFINEVKF